jgi:transglutaminase-like putative cysteine protease
MDDVSRRDTTEVVVELSYHVTQPATIVLQLAIAAAADSLQEQLDVASDGRRIPVTEISAPVGGRQHVVSAPAGELTVRYSGRLASAPGAVAAPVTTVQRIDALRPSRYCPSDRVLGLAAAEFGGIGTTADRVRAVCRYVADRTAYTAGSSGPSTDAVDTLLSGTGVCRDYAHVVAMLCRAAGVAARLVAVYAPGLSPMDMHAVVETDVDGSWQVWDATRLAPRQSLVRVATGRDAADTAFATVLDGRATLEELHVTAVAPGVLPQDDHRELVAVAVPGT